MLTGSLINAGTVLLGSSVGALLGDHLPESLRRSLRLVIGLFTLLLGLQMGLQSKNPIILLSSLFLGAFLGEILQIDHRLSRAGKWIEDHLGGQGGGGEAIIGPFIVFCIGPFTLLGCLREGLTGDYSLLLTKSLLDGFSSIGFSASLGWKVLLSAVPLFLFQGGLSLTAGGLQHWMTSSVKAELFGTGGVTLLGLALHLLELKTVRVANLLPALFFAPLLAYGWEHSPWSR